MTRYLVVLLIVVVSSAATAQYKLYESGVLAYKEGNYEEAISNLTDFLGRSVHDKKFDADSYYYRGLAYYKKNDFKGAIPDFEQAISLDHENKGNIHWFQAKCHEKLAQHDKAVAQYTAAIAVLSGNPSAKSKLLFERGLAYENLNNKNAAFDDLLLAASLNPDDQSMKAALDRVSKAVNKKVPVTQPGTDVARGNDNKKKNDAKTVQPEPEKKREEIVADNNKPVEKNDPPASQPQTNEQTPPVTQPATKTRLQVLQEMYEGEKRYALVIGNSNYPKEVGALRNPVNDATDVAKELRQSNFEVQLLTNATYIQMREAMRLFHEKLTAGPKDQTVGLFYFAGHGVQFDDENYLVPLDATVEFEDDIPRMCFPVQRIVLANMERSNSRMNIVILDACRNNPFPAASRSMGSGLGEMKRARGSFIAYATAPGSIASDGTGRNGLYTQELVKALHQPGLTIEQVFKQVRANVLRLSGEKQNTWDSSNIVGDFYFKLTDN